ncbi:MAG: DUF4476 domain-containing protein [bacterium]|nr:DUF4476 domain-containing protein [bacterium]
MKKLLLIFAGMMLFSLIARSQNTANLIIFSEDGDAFYAFVNGVKQNMNPETNVKISGLSSNVSLRIEFENKALPQLKQTMMLEAGFEHSARIKRDKNKQLKLRYFGQVPLNESKSSNVAVTEYHTADTPSGDNTTGQTQENGATSGGMTTGETITQINTSGISQPAMGVGTTAPQITLNMMVNDSENQAPGQTTSSSQISDKTVDAPKKANTQTGTSTQGSTIKTDSPPASVGITFQGADVTVSEPAVKTTIKSTSSSTITKTYSSSSTVSESAASPKTSSAPPVAAGCTAAMSTNNFNNLKKSIESKPFSDTKMSTAKVATKNACLSVNQVKEICKLFTMDDDKLTYAKYAYEHCVDKANYYQVGEVFSFSTTVNNFNTFLEK